MAPTKSVRTYSRGKRNNLSCVEAMNILFAKNLTERKLEKTIKKGKHKIQIKELPQKIKCVLSSDESSIHVNNINNTFDKLLKSTQNNKSRNVSVKIIAKNTSSSLIHNFSNRNFSPMLSKLRSSKNKTQNSKESSNYSWFNHPTRSGERITNDLEIEEIRMTEKKAIKNRKKQDSSRDSPISLRSRLKVPDIVFTDASSINKDDESKTTKDKTTSIKKTTKSSVLDSDLSYNPIFTNSVTEKILLHSSTPLISKKTTGLIKQIISPIKTGHDEINSFILESVEEIKSWDDTFPNIEPQIIKNASCASADDYEDQEKVIQNQLDMQRKNFITVRGHRYKVTQGLNQDKSKPEAAKSFSLDDFELFFNKFNKRSFQLEDFEKFHDSLTQQQLINRELTQSQVNKLNSISLKDFESFYSAWQNRISVNAGSFLAKSHRTINYVTNRKHMLSCNKKSVDLGKKYLKLSKQFDLKNLVVVLDNILVKNRTEKMKKSKSLCQTALMNSILRKQPVVNLTRLSIKPLKASFKAKDRLSLNDYKACRKFSSNFTPKRHSDLSNIVNVPSSNIFDVGQLFINITRMPLNGMLSPKVKEVKDYSTNRMKKSVRISGDSQRFKENEVKSDSTPEKENDKSRGRKPSKSHENRKSITNQGKKNSSSTPSNKSSNHKNNNQQIRKQKMSDINKKSKIVDYEDVDSEDERTSIKLVLLSDSLNKTFGPESGGKKEYIAKILVGSVSDSELELRNTNNTFLRQISKSLRESSQGNIHNNLPKVSDILSSSKTRKSTRVLPSYNNISLDSFLHTPPKSAKHYHRPSPTELELEVSSRLSKTYHSNDNISYSAQNLSDSILLNKKNDIASLETAKIREIVVNCTLHKSLGQNNTSTDVTPIRESTSSMRKSQNTADNSESDRTEDNSKHKNSKDFSIPTLNVSAKDTPQNTEYTTRPSARKSLCCGNPNLAVSINSTISEDDFIESSINTPNGDHFKAPMILQKWKQKVPNLKAGKSWRRSFLMHKKESFIDLTQDFENADSYLSGSTRPSLGQLNSSAQRQSIKIVPLCDSRLSRRKTVLQTYAQTNLSIILDDSITDLTDLTPEKSKVSLEKSLPLITAKDLVLKRCGQTEAQLFERLYPKSLLKDCKKIGEGVYGEVFLYTNRTGESTVMKVIPIEGDKLVNGERQKKFEEILSEIVIALELSKLRKNGTNKTSAFSEVQRICCVKGRYPKNLLDLWEEYHNSKGSENDHPRIFEDDQLYIVLDLANGGRDLEAFVFNNALQAVSMFKQVACALAVAEQQMQFEHRDLHWGNVLLKSVDKNKKVSSKHKGKVIESHTQGVEVTIIDFTLSRIVHDGVVIFNDLGQDPDLFVAEGDYQFEIYRLMKNKNANDWQKFEPHTNVLWLHYILDKSITALRYKNTRTKIHKKNINCLKEYERVILDFKSASDFVSEYYKNL